MKRAPRGLAARVVIAAAVCAGLSTALAAFVLISWTIDGAMRRMGALSPQLDPIELARCERDPVAFARSIGEELELRTYDEQLRPTVPDAPPLDPVLLERLRAGEASPSRMYFLDLEWGGAALRRASERGPCAHVQLRWRVSYAERNWTLTLILLLLAGSVAAAVGLASFFAVRPVASRLERLRRAAQQVGRDAGYASADDPTADDLGQLSHLLDQAHARIAADARRAAARERALEDHLANIAHDLRTPLASLQIALEQLSARDAGDGLVRGAIDDVVYLGALIDDLNLACQLEDGADPLRGDPRVDLGAVVDRLARRFAALGRARGIEVHGARPDAPVWARCNPAMAEQAIANLAHNAVAHGEPGGHVAILLEESGNGFTLSVVDDGPGVPPADLPRIGERTFRSDEARRRDPRGSGLGLAITGEVCRRANFTLSFVREEPRGLRATVSGSTTSP